MKKRIVQSCGVGIFFALLSVNLHAGPLNPGWTAQDIGSTTGGSSSLTSGTYTVTGAGADIWASADAFQFAYQPLNGDGVIVAKVNSATNSSAWAKTGIMMRASLDANAAQAMMVASPTSSAMSYMWRPTTSAVTSAFTQYSQALPVWFKIQRTGSTFIGSYSTNGTTWTELQRQTITMPTNIYVGLVQCSCSGTVATTTMSNVSVTPQLMSVDIGSVGLAGSTTANNGIFTVNGSGSDIWGFSDQFQYAYQPFYGNGTIIAQVTSIQNTNANAKGGIMLRSSLDPASAFAMMGISPGGVVSFLTRTSTAAAVSATQYGYPAPTWVKLTRSGDGSVITGYLSTDGVTWVQSGPITLTGLPATVYVGLAVTSHSNSALCASNIGSLSMLATAIPPPPPNLPPTTSAGKNQTIILPASVTLTGALSDDGLAPGTPTPTATWKKRSGPGTVTFANANSLSTTATFSAAGTYVLRLIGSDSQLYTPSDIVVEVLASAPGSTGKTVHISSTGNGYINYPNAQTSLNLVAGDTVYVDAGTYTGISLNNMTGTASLPINVVCDPNAVFTTSGYIENVLSNNAFVNFKNFRYENYTGRCMSIKGSSHDLLFKNFNIQNVSDYPFYVYDSTKVFNGTKASTFYNMKWDSCVLNGLSSAGIVSTDYQSVSNLKSINLDYEVVRCTFKNFNCTFGPCAPIQLDKAFNANIHDNLFVDIGMVAAPIGHNALLVSSGYARYYNNTSVRVWADDVRSFPLKLNALGYNGVNSVNLFYDNITLEKKKYPMFEVNDNTVTQADLDNSSGYFSRGTSKIYFNTLYRSRQIDYIGVLADIYASNVTVQNNIVIEPEVDVPYDSGRNYIYNIGLGGLTGIVSNSNLVFQTFAASGLIDPISFVPSSGSSARNASTTGSISGITTDFYGNNRYNGVGDLGAVESP